MWHASIRNHATDRTLTDQQWAHIAAEMVAAVDLAPHGDPHAVRWVAIRHADDHIHIVATLVRQDGNTVWAWNERLKAQAAARDLEQRYGLYQLGPADRTAHRHPRAAEQNKTARQGHTEIPRDRLRREVRATAAAATDEAKFFTRLQAAGVLVRVRHSTVNPDEVTGYAVGLPDHHTAAGDTVWYGGGRLASDLTLPQLRRRWRSGSTVASDAARPRPGTHRRATTFRQATEATRRAAEDLAHAGVDHDAASTTAYSAADVLVSTARSFEGRRGGPLTDAAEIFDRAARERHRRPLGRSRRASELRSLARLIAVMGRLTGDNDTAAALQLVLQLSMLADNLADLREAQDRLHQARAARRAADKLRSIAAHGLGSAALSAAVGPTTWPRTNVAGRPRADRPTRDRA